MLGEIAYISIHKKTAAARTGSPGESSPPLHQGVAIIIFNGRSRLRHAVAVTVYGPRRAGPGHCRGSGE